VVKSSDGHFPEVPVFLSVNRLHMICYVTNEHLVKTNINCNFLQHFKQKFAKTFYNFVKNELVPHYVVS